VSWISNCRSCDSLGLEPVLDLGAQRLTDFRDDDKLGKAFPLDLVYCSDCHLVQLSYSVPPELMYHDRYGFKSGVNEAIRADLHSIVKDGLRLHPDPRRWLDIASNDGTLLSYVNGDILDQSDWHSRILTVGIDPVAPLCAEAVARADQIINDYFAPGLVAEHGPFNVITSISMFYDLDDPNEFVEGVKRVLAAGGVWIVQQNYVGSMLDLNAVDNICHEHREYYSLLALNALLDRHGLEVFDVSLSSVNGGCFRTAIARTGERKVSANVYRLMGEESVTGIGEVGSYRRFAADALDTLDAIGSLIRGIIAKGERVWIYGASTRGGTIWQGAGLTRDDLPFAVDRNPAKVGKFMSSIGSEIISEERARAERPEYMVVSPWFFRDLFVKRERDYLAAGGKLIFPLPELEVVSDAKAIAA
jgi:SAM-dependent methyltransferase